MLAWQERLLFQGTHRCLAVRGSVWEQAAVFLAHAGGRGQAQRQNGGHDVAGVIGKVAGLGNLEAVELNDRQVLVVAHVHAAQERLLHLLPERRLHNAGEH